MVKEVAFHTGVDDPLGYACRLLRKAYRQGAQVVVTGAPAQLQRLDQALWVFEPQEFVPHARLRAGEAAAERLAQRTPIWLAEPGAEPPPAPVLVNLGTDWLRDELPFERIIEIVATDDESVGAARRRWKRCEAAGWPVTHHPQGARR
jgi:DNA polymerase-3 subunit chi